MHIVSRSTWGARYERGFGPASLPASELWLHHSVTTAPIPDAVVSIEYAAMRALEGVPAFLVASTEPLEGLSRSVKEGALGSECAGGA